MQRFLSFGYWCAVVGGLLLAVGAGLSLNDGGQPMSARAVTGAFIAASALRLAGATAMIIGVSAIYVRQSEAAKRLGLVAYVLVIINMVLQAGWMWADLFLSGVVAKAAPEVLDGSLDEPRLVTAFLTAWILNTAFVLFGVATLRAGQFSKPVGWSLIVMGAITLVPLPVDGPAYEVIIGAACLVAGVFARRVPAHSASAPTSSPALATA